MAEQELKACPFCGSAGTWQHGEYMYFVWCEKCDAHGGDRRTKDEAIAAWNTRAEPVGVPTVQATTYDPELLRKLPKAVIEAERVISGYFNDTDGKHWELGGIQKRSAAPSQPVAGKPSDAQKAWQDDYHKADEELQPSVPSDEQMLAAFNSAESVIDGLHEVRALLTTANAGKDAQTLIDALQTAKHALFRDGATQELEEVMAALESTGVKP